MIAAIDGAPVASTFDYAARVLGARARRAVVADVRASTPRAVGTRIEPRLARARRVAAAVVGAGGDAARRRAARARRGRADRPARRCRARGGSIAPSIMYAMVYVGALSWSRLRRPSGARDRVPRARCSRGRSSRSISRSSSTAARPRARRGCGATLVVAVVLGAACASRPRARDRRLPRRRRRSRRCRGWSRRSRCRSRCMPRLHRRSRCAYQIRAHRVATGHGARSCAG